MVDIRRILITTDLSEHSLAAFDHAFSFAMLYAAKVYVLYVVNPPTSLTSLASETEEHRTRLKEEGARKLDEFILAHLGTERKVIPVVRYGVAEKEIIRFVAEERINLVVMATHGWTGLMHILLGSVAEKVVRYSAVPVMTVKPKPAREELVRRDDIELELHLK